jgi:predicted dehydrogenase
VALAVHGRAGGGVGKKYGAKLTPTIGMLKDQDVEAVVIAGPIRCMHAEHRCAVNAGKHVLCEADGHFAK